MTETHADPADTHIATDGDERDEAAGAEPAPRLTAVQARIVGCLIEKEHTTPADYPLTLNALRRACNQSTSRHPVVDYDESVIDTSLHVLKSEGLVRFVHSPSNRATKYRHSIGERWQLSDPQLAVLAVLMLRGAQTANEILTRTDRMVSFSSAEELHGVLETLAAPTEPFVVHLERRPGQKDRRWAQLVTGAPDESDLDVAPERRTRSSSNVAELETRVEALEAEVARLAALVAPPDEEVEQQP